MCSLKCVNIWHRALEMCVWIHAWIGVGGDGYVCFHICSKDLFLSCPRLKWSRETWWCSIHFLNSLFSFQFDLFVLGCKCQFVISWELFSVPESQHMGTGPKCSAEPCHSWALINPQPLRLWEKSTYFDVSHLPFPGFNVENSILQKRVNYRIPRGNSHRFHFSTAGVSLVDLIPGISLQSVPPEISFLQDKTVY